MGKSRPEKFVLDVRVLLNNRLSLNIELQVINKGNWIERSLVYLCRSFDQLNKGQDYIEVKPVIQICIQDFTLFPGNEEFYATYKLMNVKNHKIYSDKIRISVLDLTQIELATEEDKRTFAVNATETMFPYLRAAITNLTADALINPLTLPAVSGATIFPDDRGSKQFTLNVDPNVVN